MHAHKMIISTFPGEPVAQFCQTTWWNEKTWFVIE